MFTYIRLSRNFLGIDIDNYCRLGRVTVAPEELAVYKFQFFYKYPTLLYIPIKSYSKNIANRLNSQYHVGAVFPISYQTSQLARARDVYCIYVHTPLITHMEYCTLRLCTV